MQCVPGLACFLDTLKSHMVWHYSLMLYTPRAMLSTTEPAVISTDLTMRLSTDAAVTCVSTTCVILPLSHSILSVC